MAQNTDTKVVTGKVRLSYVHLFEPFSNNPDQDAKYSCVLLIPKSDKTTYNKLRAAQKSALENGKTKFGGSIPKSWKDTIHDGDEEADLERNPGIVATALHCVNAIPYVCAARPGLLTYLDLPPVAGRAATALHR